MAIVLGNSCTGDCTPFRDFPLECAIPNSTPLVRMQCMMSLITDIPAVDRDSDYVHTEFHHGYFWDCLQHVYVGNGEVHSPIHAISEQVDAIKCSEHLMAGSLPITHPDMRCVFDTAICNFMDLDLEQMDERRELPWNWPWKKSDGKKVSKGDKDKVLKEVSKEGVEQNVKDALESDDFGWQFFFKDE